MTAPDDRTPKPATEQTRAVQAAFAELLDLADEADVERATRGLVAEHPTGVIDRGGFAVWDVHRHDFVRADRAAPDTVNPSLWRQARLNCIHGLFEVVPGRVWQVRGYDISNITFVAGDTGWIVIDPLTSEETAAASLALATEHLGERPVLAVIHTHSHIDHFGGVLGVTSVDDVAAGRCRIIAPEHFLAEAVSENVIAGPVMIRRAMYMYGALLPQSPTGHVDAGLGKATPLGSTALIAPTDEISATGTELVVDGVRIVFQSTPGTEAPAEMNFHFPDLRLLCMAENCSHNLHNLYTPRGAQVRDALAWSKYIGEAIDLFADDTDICFASHHWPRFGSEDSRRFLVQQRDLYRWIHDQTMRLANHGLTPLEIAEELELPPALQTEFHARGYYGTVNHNVKAVYQRYIGWFDGNPAHLHELPPVEAAVRHVEYMGGADAVLARARRDFAAGDYRWVAEVVNHVVFADPSNVEARALQADALEQLGYQAESGPWRNFYLTGAQELRAESLLDLGTAGLGGLAPAMTTEMLFDAIAVRLVPDRLDDSPWSANWVVTDRDERHVAGLSNRTLFHRIGATDDAAACTVTLSSTALIELIDGAALDDVVAGGGCSVDGDDSGLRTLLAALDTFARVFPIVTP
jgi:alkyl sulfatase BDS1-like metallo-beta-lactamase superfamily hydrolase